MPTVVFDNKEVDYSLNLKPWKRRMTLLVNSDGVVVAAPKSIRKLDVEKFIHQHALWILRQQEKFRILLRKNPPKKFVSGEYFPVLGRDCLLQVLPELNLQKPFCRLEGEHLQVFVDVGSGELQRAVRETLLRFYFEQASEKIDECIRQYAPLLGLWPLKVRIADQKSRWGSCSGQGSLRFNWRLAMTPSSILEYVVIHELGHIKHRNHSENFWRLVESVLPDYKVRRAWLRENSFRLGRVFN